MNGKIIDVHLRQDGIQVHKGSTFWNIESQHFFKGGWVSINRFFASFSMAADVSSDSHRPQSVVA